MSLLLMCIPLKYFGIAHLKPMFHTHFVGIFLIINIPNLKFLHIINKYNVLLAYFHFP